MCGPVGGGVKKNLRAFVHKSCLRQFANSVSKVFGVVVETELRPIDQING